LALVGSQERLDLQEQGERLAIPDRVGEGSCVVHLRCLLRRDFSRADFLPSEIENRSLCAADADYELPAVIRVPSAQGDRALAIDQSRYVAGSTGDNEWTSRYFANRCASERKASLRPLPARGTIGGGGGTAVPSLSRRAGLCLHPILARPSTGAGRVIRIVTDPDPSAGSVHRTQPVYESLQGEGSWPSRTPRRCHVTLSSHRGFTD